LSSEFFLHIHESCGLAAQQDGQTVLLSKSFLWAIAMKGMRKMPQLGHETSELLNFHIHAE